MKAKKIARKIGKGIRCGLGFAVETAFNLTISMYELVAPQMQQEYEELENEKRDVWTSEERKEEIQKRQDEIRRAAEAYENEEVYDFADDLVDWIKGR